MIDLSDQNDKPVLNLNFDLVLLTKQGAEMKRKWSVITSVLLTVFFISGCSGEIIGSKAMDRLIKAEVETAVSMLSAVHRLHEKNEMSMEQAKKLGADLLRDLRYGSEGYFWADTEKGVNVVLYGRKDVEGHDRLDAVDPNGIPYVKEFLRIARKGGGYLNYAFEKKGHQTPQRKRSYVLAFEPFGWVVGSGYYR